MPRLKYLKIDTSKTDEELYLERRDAAEEVCWTVMIMISCGMLDIPDDQRKMLAEPLGKWSDLHYYLKGRNATDK